MEATKLSGFSANLERIMQDIEAIAGEASPQGCTRHSYSAQDKAARTYLEQALLALGLVVETDGVGNIRARLAGTDDTLPSVLVGSHIDTVTHGGRYDGLLGVVCALEVLRVFRENGFAPQCPLELVVFAEEEGSNFGVTLLGSKALVGKLSADDLRGLRNDQGESAYDVIKATGYAVDGQEGHVVRKGTVGAMLELHIEQGGVLDSMGCPVGIVHAIAGMQTYRVIFAGVSNHAGSTPMPLRKDPMLGAAATILKLNERAAHYGAGTVVATVGKLCCRPNASNAICENVELFVDIRDVAEDGITAISEALAETVGAAAQQYQLSASVDLVAQSGIVQLDPGLTRLLRGTAERLGLPCHDMNSGAVHDAVMMTDVTRVGMIFVPSIGGLSHCPEEDTRAEDIEKGCNLLIEAVYQLTKGGTV